jgi:hypothetical protein
MSIGTKNVELVRFQQPVSLVPYVWLDAVVEQIEWRVEEEKGNVEDGKEYKVVMRQRIRGLSTGSSMLDARPSAQVYEPFEAHPSLFTHFANLELDELSIKNFADKYGCLGIRKHAEIESIPYWVEDFNDWTRAIRDVQRAIKIYEATQVLDVGELNRRITKIRLKDLVKESTPVGERSIAVPTDEVRYALHLDKEIRPGDELNPNDEYDGARQYLLPAVFSEDIHKEIADDPVKQAKLLFWELVNGRLRDSLSARLTLNRKTWKYNLRFEPQNLLTVIWLQVANLADSAKQITRCVVCDNVMEIKKRGAKKNPKYCSNACSQKAYRARQSASSP